MGELHLEIIVDRLLREFRVDANVGKPQVAYRETIRKPPPHRDATCARRAAAAVRGRPPRGGAATPGEGVSFENEIIGGTIPREFIPAIEKGVREALETGVLAGTPWWMSGCAWWTAPTTRWTRRRWPSRSRRRLAFKEAARRAKPVLLEP